MNTYDAEIMNILYREPFVNQRVLAESAGCSVGAVNKSLKQLTRDGYLDGSMQLTAKARQEIKDRAPRNAIILAAGFGMRMVPINLSTPKALIEVNGELLIERTIRQLHEAGITDITVVAGFMKDSFEYLMDEYGVDLVINRDYATRNNLHSLALAAGRIHNTYIIPCDIWCAVNPFSPIEPYSWYMVSNREDRESTVRVNRKRELVRISERGAGNAMIGIACLLEPEASIVRERLLELDKDPANDDEFWEKALYNKDRMILQAKTVSGLDFVEINTYEQLRSLDSGSDHLKSDAIEAICKALHCSARDVREISALKKGMTNRSFLFTVRGAKYIMRIPGEGTDQLINRRQEADVFRAISGKGLCDDPVFIAPSTGYKITAYLDNARTCDPENEDDLQRCMAKLRSFHAMHLKVDHTFDIYGQIDFYESLWNGAPSIYRDYARTKENLFRLRPYLEGLEKDWCLTHIDAVPDNFLFYRAAASGANTSGSAAPANTSGPAAASGANTSGLEAPANSSSPAAPANSSGSAAPASGSPASASTETGELLQLTDWEYSGMQDPHVDIAMFCIYSMYNRAQCDHLIDIYFEGRCDRQTRIKIYLYIAICGLLWSNWCEYKRQFGVEFGEYSLRQYRFAKDYYRAAMELMEQNGDA